MYTIYYDILCAYTISCIQPYPYMHYPPLYACTALSIPSHILYQIPYIAWNDRFFGSRLALGGVGSLDDQQTRRDTKAFFRKCNPCGSLQAPSVACSKPSTREEFATCSSLNSSSLLLRIICLVRQRLGHTQWHAQIPTCSDVQFLQSRFWINMPCPVSSTLHTSMQPARTYVKMQRAQTADTEIPYTTRTF